MALRVQLLLILAGAALVGALMFMFLVMPQRKELAAANAALQKAEEKLAQYRNRRNQIQAIPEQWRPRLKDRIKTFDDAFENINGPKYKFANNALIRSTYIKDKIYRLLRRATRSQDFGPPLFDFALVGETFVDLHNIDGELETIEFTVLGEGDQNLVGLVLERIERDEVPEPPPGVKKEHWAELARVVEYRVEHLEEGRVSLFARIEMVIATKAK